ncbi:MAG: C40 family peptidase [Bacteroidetes bacterium]|nr:C40 family peptidase [Bacteroidota bacterium]
MENGICLHSVIPVRAEPSHKSEMVTQVLFGELYCVIEKESSWVKIKLLFDGYEGWIDRLQANMIDDPEYLRLANSETSVTIDLLQLLSFETERMMIPLVIGSSLPGFDESRIRVGQNVYYYEGLVSESLLHQNGNSNLDTQRTGQQLIEEAMLYMNAPYLWGGRTPFGIDCSGFVQMVYKLQGYKLLRDASQQAGQGEVISLPGEAEPGDLAFFDDVEGNITHVGMLIDRQRIIHCSGKVQIDSFDQEGIYSVGLKKYTHKLRLIKRIF